MKVFLSWSGDVSHKVALVLRDWLPSVIQSVEPYVSSEDIDKGARWSTDIAKELEASSYGILCVTRENIEAAWLNFEAGALSKSVEKGRVSPFLFGVKRSEVKAGPILQFQSTLAEKDDVRKLLVSLNAACPQGRLEEARLDTVFDVWWPQLEVALRQVEKHIPQVSASQPLPSAQPPQGEILEELLELVRQQNRVLNDPVKLVPPSYLEAVLGNEKDETLGSRAWADLAERWTRVTEEAARARDGDSTFASLELVKAVDRLRMPLEYLMERSRKSRFRSRRVQLFEAEK